MTISYIVSEMGFDEEAGDQISLAFIEAVSNAIKHGNENNPEETVQISFRMDQDKLAISVKDCGSGFDLECVEVFSSTIKLPTAITKKLPTSADSCLLLFIHQSYPES
jgi:anti-sigma regulatory factor (Ser/Thr protein kinase)